MHEFSNCECSDNSQQSLWQMLISVESICLSTLSFDADVNN